MTAPLLDRLGLTPASLTALPAGEQRRVVQFLLRWEAFGDALACLDRALQLDDAAPALRSTAWHGLGRTADALHLLEESIRQRNDPTLRLAFVEIALDAGELARASAQLQPALEETRHLSRAWWLAVRLYLAMDEITAAQRAIQQLSAQAASSYYVDLCMMDLMRSRGDKVTATAHAVRALEQESHGEPLAVSELVMLRAFFHAIDDRIHARAVETRLVDRFESEHKTLSDALATAAAPDLPAQLTRKSGGLSFFRRAPAPSLARTTSPTNVTVTAAERQALLKDVRSLFGFTSLLPGQAEILTCARRGEHLLAILPTGAGKSLCYQLPAFLDNRGLTLVVSPLIALMKDQVDNLPPAMRTRTLAINSLMDGDDLRSAIHRIATGQVRLLYAAPERLRQVSFVAALARTGVVRLVVDEAHCVSVWGHDFRPDYLHLRQVHRDLGGPPLLAMTATAPAAVREDIERQLLGGFGSMRVIAGDTFRPNLHLRALRVRADDERTALLLRLLRSLQGSGIIYARSRRRCEELAATLRQQGFAAAHYHAGIDNRAEIQDRFMRNDLQVIVATVAFGMGIDKGDIRFIVHDGLPSSLESYYQEIGRAGRDGSPAHCVLLFADYDEATKLRLAGRASLTIEALRALYQQVRQHLGDRISGRVPLDPLAATVGDGATARVGLSLLEEAGLLHRHYDAPRTVTLRRPRQMRGQHDTMFMDFAHQCGLDHAETLTADFEALAEAVGALPAEMERWLVDWQEARYLAVHFDGRDPLIEVTPAPAQAVDSLAQILRNRAALDQQRVSDIARYARTTGCRHGFLADYLGGEHRARCGVCDNCGASFQLAPDPTAFDSEAHLLIILQALVDQNWGRRNLVRLLRGDPTATARAQQASFYGALRTRSERSLEQLLDSLQGDGLIQLRELEHGGVVLELTRRGVQRMNTLSRQKRRR